jgi:hypothetical protein
MNDKINGLKDQLIKEKEERETLIKKANDLN